MSQAKMDIDGGTETSFYEDAAQKSVASLVTEHRSSFHTTVAPLFPFSHGYFQLWDLTT
jgi:hypothetical protein